MTTVALTYSKGTPRGRRVSFGQGWEWIATGGRIFARSPGWLILICVGLGSPFVAVGIAQVFAFHPAGLAVFLILVSLTLLALPGLLGGAVNAVRELDEGREIRFRHLFEAFLDPGRRGRTLGLGGVLLLAFFVLAVTFSVTMATTAYSNYAMMQESQGASTVPPEFLFAVVLVGVVALIALWLLGPAAFFFSVPLVALGRVRPLAAIGSSFSAAVRNFLPFLLYFVLFLIFGILAALTVFGMLILAPIAIAASYASFRDVYPQVCGRQAATETTGRAPKPATDPDVPAAPARLVAQLGERGYIHGENPALAPLVALGDRVIPDVLPVLDSGDLNAVVDAMTVLGRLEARAAVPRLEALAESNLAEIHQGALTALAQIRGGKGELELDEDSPYQQIAQLWTAIIQSRQDLHRPEVLERFCERAIESMPDLEFPNADKRARAWGMLGSLYYKATHPDWDSDLNDTSPCAVTKRCYDEAYRADPDPWWRERGAPFA